jgi:MFS family permease
MTSKAIQRYFVGLSRNTFLLACTSLFADISTEMLYPILPVFLTQTLKASGSVVGLIDGFAQATQNIVQGFAGTLSDKLQRRKPIALAGYFLAAISKPLMGLATVWQVLIAGFFVFYGLLQGIFRTAGKALASSFVPDRLRASGIGWYNTTVGVLQLVASLVAGTLWDHVGHVAVFNYGAACAVVGALALWLLIPEAHDR